MQTDIIDNIARKAGEKILGFYSEDYIESNPKADDSPLTKADLAAHHYIKDALEEAYPEIPVLSEEGSEIPYETRKQWQKFWLVDPLDGTKEFIKKTGEFTVNIALIDGNEPVLGVIHIPESGISYMAKKGSGAWMITKDGTKQEIRSQSFDNERPPVFVASKDHAGPAVKKLLETFPDASLTSMGSSLKFCLVAQGKADCYLRDVPTMEWDTAAAQIIAEEAGGVVCTLDGKPLSYNKEILRNPSVYSAGDNTFDWPSHFVNGNS